MPNTWNLEKSKTKPCLAELSFGIALDGVLIAQGPPSLEKIQLTMNHTKTIIHGGLYDFIRDAKSAKRRNDRKSGVPKVVLKPATISSFNPNDAYQRISPIIPKVHFFNRSILNTYLLFY